VWAALLAVLIAMIGQGVWTMLIATNLRTSPAIPWAVVVMAPLIWLMWQYLSGKWWPRNTSEARRRHLRANMVSGPVFAWALVAGASATAPFGTTPSWRLSGMSAERASLKS